MTTAPAAARRRSISPADLRNILKWMFLLRLSLSTAIVLAGAVFWTHFFGASSLVLLLFLALAYLFTAYGFWRLRSGRAESIRFLWLQLAHDLAFVTTVVLYTDGVGSAFTLLYIPLVALASILFGMAGGALFASAASSLFILLAVYQREFASSVAWTNEYFPRLTPPEEPFPLNVLILVALFFLVAILTAFLRERLVTAGARVRELETEIRFMTIDTREVLDSIESGVISIDDRGDVAFINREGLELLDLKMLTDDPRALWRELRARAPALAEVLVETLEFKPAVSRGEIEIDNAKGHAIPLGITTNLLYDESGARRGVTAVFRDISQVKRMEKLARQRDRLAAIAELSASLAHEIKNPLAGIRSAVELLSTDAPRTAEDARLFRLIVKESDRLSKLLTDFLQFARMELREEVPVNLRDVLEDVVELSSLPSQRPAPDTVLEVEGPDPVIDGDVDLLKQLFQNLLTNAVQAAGERDADGRVTITISRTSPENAERYGLDPIRFVETRVTDNGPGIAPSDLPRIFDPFFTTKAQGNGLGLAIVHRIVNVHGGAIFVESTPAQGAEFRVYLPLSHRPARTKPRERARAVAARH